MNKICIFAMMAILITTTVTANSFKQSTVDPLSNWCQGTDLDRSGHVEAHDLNMFRSYYGSLCDPFTFCEGADFNKNGWVEMNDFIHLANHYGSYGCYE